jgi:hyperosmotically inducible protein
MKRVGIPGIIALGALSIGCGGARPYRAMAKAASSEENVAAQAEDHRLKMRMRETIAASDPQKVIDVTPYAYMGHAYLVGFVGDRSEADALVTRVRSIEDVRSVDTYLAAKPADRSVADDLEIKGKVKAALATDPEQRITQIEIEVLAGHVVLLGVVRSPETVADAGRRASSVGGVTAVTNFLLVPESEYKSARPRLRDRLLSE